MSHLYILKPKTSVTRTRFNKAKFQKHKTLTLYEWKL